MDINIRVNTDEFITKELQGYIKSKLPEIVNEIFFENPIELNKIIRECVKGQLKSRKFKILQGMTIKNALAERIMKQSDVDMGE